MLNRISENLNYSRSFIFPVILFGMIILVFSIIVLNISSTEFFFLTVLLTFLSASLLFYLGHQTRKDYQKIISIIDGIRLNRFETPDEIKLKKNLFALEESIRSMFFRTRTDITDLKKLQKVRTEFLGNVSHELRTPIFAIQGYLETLHDGAVNDPVVNLSFLKKAIFHTNNLNVLLNDLIEISMIESGDMSLSFNYFNIHEYLEGILTEFKPAADQKRIILGMEKVPKELKLMGDPKRLRQVFSNLISNAIKYTDRGKIEIIVEEEDEYGKIIVKDTGLGISERDQSRIFERFYRIERDRNRAAGGTGLGLAIVKHIVEAHKSKVEVKSKLGFGSEFSFRLRKEFPV